MILADEAKSIHDDVFTPLHGHLARVRIKRRARLRHVLPVSDHPSAISGLAFWVKSSECPHISQQSIQIDRQISGEH